MLQIPFSHLQMQQSTNHALTFSTRSSLYPQSPTQRPILLKGHERSITVTKFNHDGDLLFTASKDHTPSMWRSEDGERIGTFNGHKGTIWDLDVERFSGRVVTASADA